MVCNRILLQLFDANNLCLCRFDAVQEWSLERLVLLEVDFVGELLNLALELIVGVSCSKAVLTCLFIIFELTLMHYLWIFIKNMFSFASIIAQLFLNL